jgi:four helix bundle protein
LRVIDAAEEFVASVNRCAAAKHWVYATQLRRAAGSVYANLVEGYGRGPGADRKRLYRIARAECEEALGWIRQARNANELPDREFFNLMNRGVVIARMINGLVM